MHDHFSECLFVPVGTSLKNLHAAHQMIIPVLARTPEGAKRLLSMIEGYGAAAADLAVPLKTCAMACVS